MGARELKNNLFINLFFSFNKFNIDSLSLNLFFLRFDIKSFFYINKNLIFLLLHCTATPD